MRKQKTAFEAFFLFFLAGCPCLNEDFTFPLLLTSFKDNEQAALGKDEF